MTKPIIYDLSTKTGLNKAKVALKRKPSSMWIKTPQGNVKAMFPIADYIGPIFIGVRFNVMVEPRWCATIKNYQ